MMQILKDSLYRNVKRNAFCINEQYYTYKTLFELINSIRLAIIENGDSRTKRIGIVTTDTLQTYASIIACWFSGFAYIPISPALPKERNRFIADQANIDIILTSEEVITDILDGNSIKSINTSTLNVSETELGIVKLTDEYLMYILFTSGSTGIPKGVPISYGNLKAFIESYNALKFNSSAEDRFLQMFDLTFDVSIASYLVPLLLGACVYTVPVKGIKYMNVYKILRNHKITFASIVPSIVNYLKPYFKEINLPELKYCILTAEASNIELVKLWANCIPNSKLVNLYGPTEATIWCMEYTYSNSNEKSYNGMLAIGKPFLNVETLILDSAGNVVGEEVKGELCIASNQLTDGYLNNKEKNNISFFFKDKYRFYRTGDLCYKDNNEDIYYCGRIDHQVKIQGFRIELSEIEVAVKEISEINNVAIVYKNKLGVDQICLFLEKYTGEVENIKTELEKRLPYYMIPSQINKIDELPHNTSGKIDRVTLSSLVVVNEY